MSNPVITAISAFGRRDKIACLLLVLVLAILYGACQNAQWIPGGGDDAYYLAIARNLASGKGYLWNDMPVVIIPPGWPVVLALLMQVSRSFAFLNLALMAMCIGTACLWYFILRRFANPLCVWLVVLVAATLFEWHRFTFTFYSEAFFYLLLAGSVLLAMQISEGRGGIWKIVILLVLSTALVSMRWTGLLAVALPVSALLTGQIRPKLDRKWLTVVVLIAASVAAFKTIQHWQREHANRILASETKAEKRDETLAAMKWIDRQEEAAFKRNPMAYVTRGLNSGRWLSTLFWPPTVMGMSQKTPRLIFNLLGWVLILLLALSLMASMRRREWTWIGLLLFCVATVMIRYSHVARYLAPVAPLLLLGIWRAVDQRSSVDGPVGRRKLPRIVVAGLILTIGMCNLSILAANAWVARSANFASLCLAGEYQDILSVAEYLQRYPASQAKVGVYAEYHDPIRTGRSSWAERVMVLLTDREVATLGGKSGPQLSDEKLLSWAKSQDIKYLVTRPPNVSARLWHFKIPSWGDDSTAKEVPYYILLKVSGKKMKTVELPKAADGLRKVPGF